MRELALHLLDIAENSVSALASIIRISIEENRAADRLRMVIGDNGKGMDTQTVARITDPFVTSRTTRKVGLGLPLLKAAAEACNGGLEIWSEVGQGTTVTIEFQLSHIDRMPLGDLSSTLMTLVIGSPEVRWVFQYTVDGHVFEFDTQPILETLDGVPLTDPAILAYLRNMLEEGVAEVRQPV